MKPLALQLAIAVAAVLALAAGPAGAQVAAPAPASASASASVDPLFAALGGQPGIARVVDGFVARLAGDPRLARYFERTDLVEFRKQLVDQFCAVAGGPCRYEGADMKKAHADLDISKAAFHRTVELLQAAMDAEAIAFADQNRLLARLAPMHRDIVTAR